MTFREEIEAMVNHPENDYPEFMPDEAVLVEAERIYSLMVDNWLLGYEYSPYEGTISIEVSPFDYRIKGHAVLVRCEPGGSALCCRAHPGVATSKRFDSSEGLPFDEYLIEGLDRMVALCEN